MLLLDRKQKLTIFLGNQVQLEGAVIPSPKTKTIVSKMGRLSRKNSNVRVI
jgi:hypothetical protein